MERFFYFAFAFMQFGGMSMKNQDNDTHSHTVLEREPTLCSPSCKVKCLFSCATCLFKPPKGEAGG